MESFHKKNSRVFKALSDERRLAIMSMLRSGEKCACVLSDELGIGQSALSYHMKILCESNIVKGRQAGKWTHYSLDEKGSKFAISLLAYLTTPNLRQE